MQPIINSTEKRRKLEQATLAQTMKESADMLGLHQRGMVPPDDHLAIRQVLTALEVTDYELNDDGVYTLEEQLRTITQSRGIMMREVSLKDGWWKKGSGPVLGYNMEGQLMALLPTWAGYNYRYTAADGTSRKLKRGDMGKVMSSKAYLFTKALPLKKLSLKDVMVFAWQSIDGYLLSFLLLTALAVVLLGMFFPLANKLVFGEVIPAGDAADLLPIVGLLVGAALSMMLITFIRNIYILRLQNIIEINLHNAVSARLFLLPVSFFKKYGSGELTSKLNNLTQVCHQINEIILGALLAGLLSVVYFVQVGYYGKILFWPACLLFFLQTLFVILYFRSMDKMYSEYIARNDSLSGMEYELFAGMQKIKLTGSERRAFTQWVERFSHTVRRFYNPSIQLRIYPALLALVSTGGLVLIYKVALDANIALSDFVAFTSAFGMMTTAVSQIALQIPELSKIGPMLASIKPIIEEVPEVESGSKVLKTLTGNIEVNHLTFRYLEDTPPVIDDLSLSIRPGEYVGIVGGSGCGKSTLLRLLLGFETPQRGNICYDNYDLSQINKSLLRSSIGTCLQNGSLFAGDILHNITITAPWATQEQVWDALRQACLYDDVKALPMGLYTFINESGSGFSGGQKQRLLIARALISKPRIVFFDEATSALDNISQKQVSDNLDRLNCTRVIIAHRLSTIRHCDRIIVLDQGKIVDEGTYEELMERKGLFYNMVQRQL